MSCTIASGPNVRLAYIEEETVGVCPATPDMQIMRMLTRDINLKKAMLESGEVRSDRQFADVRHGFNEVGGSLGFEMSRATHDDMLESVMGGRWAAITVGSTGDLTLVASTGVLTRASGNNITDGLFPGLLVRTTGFTNSANNGTFRIAAVTSSTVTLIAAGATLVNEGPVAATLAVPGKVLKVGQEVITYTMERAFTDAEQYEVFHGVNVTQATLDVAPGKIVSGTFTLMGMSADSIAGSEIGNSYTAATTSSPFAPFDGSLYEGATANAVITSVNFTLANGRKLEGVVGSKFSPCVFDGRFKCTGKVSVFFLNAAMKNKFINETESSLWLKLNDPNGTDWLNVIAPRIKYTDGGINPPQEGPITVEMPFMGLVDSVSGTTLAFQRSNA